jgi:hypothetical protein
MPSSTPARTPARKALASLSFGNRSINSTPVHQGTIASQLKAQLSVGTPGSRFKRLTSSLNSLGMMDTLQESSSSSADPSGLLRFGSPAGSDSSLEDLLAVTRAKLADRQARIRKLEGQLEDLRMAAAQREELLKSEREARVALKGRLDEVELSFRQAQEAVAAKQLEIDTLKAEQQRLKAELEGQSKKHEQESKKSAKELRAAHAAQSAAESKAAAAASRARRGARQQQKPAPAKGGVGVGGTLFAGLAVGGIYAAVRWWKATNGGQSSSSSK